MNLIGTTWGGKDIIGIPSLISADDVCESFFYSTVKVTFDDTVGPFGGAPTILISPLLIMPLIMSLKT